MQLGVRVSSGMPLCYAVGHGKIDVARLLVEGLGADVNQAVIKDGKIVMPFVMKGFATMARCLVKELGTNVNQSTEDGCTPLHMVATKGNVTMVRVLKELGVDVNQPDDKGASPLHMVAQKGDVAMARVLVKELGVDVNYADLQGRFPLFWSALCGHVDLVPVLVEELGADIYLAALNNVTALMAAARGKHDKLIRWLTKHGADLQTSAQVGMAVEVSRAFGAPVKQTTYLEAKAHCTNPGCDGVGLRKCQGCKVVRYCGMECGLAHWPVHKAECKRMDKA
jgi:ankyrin repeat protein